MLEFDPSWRFQSPGGLASGAREALWTMLGVVIGQRRDQAVVEHFKRFFAPIAGKPSGTSSSRSWAISDLEDCFDAAAEANAPLFLEAFHASLDALGRTNPGVGLPTLDYVNQILADHRTGFQILPPRLVAHQSFQPIAVQSAISFEQEARQLIEESLQDSERYLAAGKYRSAVQEGLWLLETVATAFRYLNIDNSTVTGKYFNVIAKELRAKVPGTSLDQMLAWTMSLHGYLSSPTGGGLRHGRDLRDGLELTKSAATLYCNLIRSYVSFLINEHERISEAGP